MNEVPPDPEEHPDVGELYRRASALDPSRPSDVVRRRVLDHAAQLAAERAAANDAARIGRKRAANQSWWRPAIFGTLAAAGLAGLLIAPRFLTPNVTPLTASSPSQEAAKSAPPAPAVSPAPAAEPPHAPAPAELQGLAKPQAFARNSGQIANPAAGIAEKNAPAKVESKLNARSSAAASDGAEMDAAPARSDPAAELRRRAATGDISKLQMLLDNQPLIEARDESGRTALMLATLRGQTQAVDVLLAHGADPNAADARGTTPLQAAIDGNQQQIAVALRRAGAR